MTRTKPPTVINGKMTLLKLLNHYGVSMISLAHKSGVEVGEIHKIVKGEAVEQEIAEKVLNAFSRIARIKYTENSITSILQIIAALERPALRASAEPR